MVYHRLQIFQNHVNGGSNATNTFVKEGLDLILRGLGGGYRRLAPLSKKMSKKNSLFSGFEVKISNF